MALDDEGAVRTLAHELNHAQQDSERDLKAWQESWSTSEDALLATASVYEGEAMHYERLALLAVRGESPEGFDWEGMYEAWQALTFSDSDDDAAPFSTALNQLPYAFGGAFVTRTWLRAGQAGIDTLYDAPPRSSREILFGTDAGEEEARTTLLQRALPSYSSAYLPVNYPSITFIAADAEVRARADSIVWLPALN